MTIYSAADWPRRSLEGRTVIVGAGAVGITMGIALARAGHQVTILEGGPRVPRTDFRKDNEGPVTARPYPTLVNGRMKALGGTTLLWGGQLVPFHRSDFCTRDVENRKLWPITYDEVAPWIDVAYELLGIQPESRDTQAIWRKATGREPSLGESLAVGVNVWLKEPDFTRLFEEELNNHPRLEIVTDCPVNALRFSEASTRASLDVTLRDGSVRTLHPDRIALANGTIEIVGLLLRAAASQPACPYSDNKHIGRWYFDHLHFLIGDIKSDDSASLSAMFDNVYFEGRKYGVKIRQSSDSRRTGRAHIVGTLNPVMSPAQLLSEMRGMLTRLIMGGGGYVSACKRGIALGRIMSPIAWRYLRHRRSTSLFDRGIKLGVEVEQLPSPDSYVILDPEAPPETARAGVHWTCDPALIDEVARFGTNIRDLFAQKGLANVTLDPRVEARDPSFLDAISGAGHHMGGARMAAGPDSGLVDTDCKVFYSENLFVAGAAVFPSGSFANSTLTAIALGQRLAHHLAESSAEVVAAAKPFASRLVYGCSRLAGGASTKSSTRLLGAALRCGVGSIDCAPSYGLGLAERVVGDALRVRASAEVAIIAKLGSPRDPRGWAKSWPRELRRRVHDRGPRTHSGFEPFAPVASYRTSDFGPEALRQSFAIAMERLGRIDILLLHNCGPDEYTPEVATVLEDLAGPLAARIGYANGAIFDIETDGAFPPGSVAECAIDPRWLTGRGHPPVNKPLILHSIVPTGDWLARSEPGFAAALTAAALIVPATDTATARMAALYALAATRVPEAQLVFASTNLPRLQALLDSFAAIETERLAPEIAGIFDLAEST